MGVLAEYRAAVASGEATPDPAQAHAAEALALVEGRLARWHPGEGRGLWRTRSAAPMGLYLFGGPGRGKTWLMDMFFAASPFAPKRRVHFHDLLIEAHAQIALHRAAGATDAVGATGTELAKQARLLCLDELHVRDVADAAILARLFGALWGEGAVVVATSNAAPEGLFAGGLGREHLLPFLAGLAANMDVTELEAARDYRSGRLGDVTRYATPLGPPAQAAMDEAWARLGGAAETLETLALPGGRALSARTARGAARFAFAELCAEAHSAADYRAVAHRFHTLVLDDVALSPQRRDEAQRFITLVDMLYDHGTGLIVSAAAQPDALLTDGPVAASFFRTASRLHEMRDATYATRRKFRGAPAN